MDANFKRLLTISLRKEADGYINRLYNSFYECIGIRVSPRKVIPVFYEDIIRAGLTERQAFSVAEENTKAEFCKFTPKEYAAIKPVCESLRRIFRTQDQIYVISNESCYFGSGVILNKDALSLICEEWDCLRILLVPASVNGWLCVPYPTTSDVELQLQTIDTAVNWIFYINAENVFEPLGTDSIIIFESYVA